MVRLLIEERYTWPVRTVLLGGGGLRATSYQIFQEVIESVEALPPEDQILLTEIVWQRLIQHRRAELAREIAEARNAYRRGDVHRGTVMDLMKELAE